MFSDVVTVIEPPGALDGPSRIEPLPHTTVGDEGAGLELAGAGNPEGSWVTGVVVLDGPPAEAGAALGPLGGSVVDAPSADGLTIPDLGPPDDALPRTLKVELGLCW